MKQILERRLDENWLICCGRSKGHFVEDVTDIDHENNGCKDSLCNLHQQIDRHRVEGKFAIWALGHVHQHWC